MPTPCTRCQHPLKRPGACGNCNPKHDNAETSSESNFSGESGSVGTTCPNSPKVPVPHSVAKSSGAHQQQSQRNNDPQIQIAQQLQARSKLTILQPKHVRVTIPRVLGRGNSARPRSNQSLVVNSSASQVSQQVQHQIRHRYRVQCPQQNITSPNGTTKNRLVSRAELVRCVNGCEIVKGERNATGPGILVEGSSSASPPIRIIRSTSSAHNPSPVAAVAGAAAGGFRSRATHLIRAVTPVAGHSVVPSQQLVEVVEHAESTAVSPTTPTGPIQFKVAVPNGEAQPLYKILYPVASRLGITGFSSTQLTPVKTNTPVASSVMVTPSGALQVIRHASNPSAQTAQYSSGPKQITHRSLSIMSPTRARLLRSRALPSVASRLAIEPPPVVTIEDEEVSSTNDQAEKETDNREILTYDYYKLSVLRPPDGAFKGEFRLRAKQIRIGTFLLRDRFVTFSRCTLQILARPVDSFAEEVDVTFTYKDILKVVWATKAHMPAMFFHFSPECGDRIRNLLHMRYHESVKNKFCDDALYPYFEPRATLERQRQVCVILGESLSEEEYSMIENCYMSPRGSVKREFAEKLLEMTEPNMELPETPLPDGTFAPNSSDVGSPTTSSPSPGAPKKRRIENSLPNNIVTRDGVVTVTRGAQSPPKSPTDVVFTNDSSICRYPPSGKGGIVIRAPDLLTLLPDKSVNDAVIDFYLSYIIGELLPKERAEKVFAFNTFFYSSLVKDPLKTVNTEMPEARRQHANVKRWTKGVDLFSKDFILIPVCENSHWFLVIVCYPWIVPKRHKINIDPSDTESVEQTPTETATKDTPDSSTGDTDPVEVLGEAQQISPRVPPSSMQRRSDIKAGLLVFDSLRGTVTASRIFPLIRNYLAEEFLAKKGVPCTFDYYSMRGYYPMAPQQTNYHDCGIFLLEYARNFLLNPPEPKALGSSNMFSNMFDPDHIMEKGRWEVAEVMFQLCEKQFPELKGIPRLKYEKLIKVEGSISGDDARAPRSKRGKASNTPK